jgi:hypothetical protein
MGLILLVIVLFLIFGGGGWWGYRNYGPGPGIGIWGILLVILFVMWFLGGVHFRY